MFRRRRPLGRRGLVSRLVGAPEPRLVEANRRLAGGDYAWAAAQFEQLANETRRPRNAAYLYIEAGRAHLLGGKPQPAMRLFRRGLGLLAERGRYWTLNRLARRVIRELRERGETAGADEITAWLGGQPGPEQDAEQPEAAPIFSEKKPPRLPLKCPSCGGTVDPRDVEWVDEVTVECDYCGSLVRAEE
jgi:hypothetical protein